MASMSAAVIWVRMNVSAAASALNWSADLYDAPDQYHPSGKGSLLAALVLYRTLYSEKTAALDVVKRRLDDRGLGDFCLALHSHKASKRAVLAELERCLGLPAEVSYRTLGREPSSAARWG